MKLLPEPEALRQARFGWPDLLVCLGVLVMLGLLAHGGQQAMVSFHPPDVSPQVSLNPAALPDYAIRSTLRMFIALGLSTVFTLLYGSLAAHNRRAERVLIPLLDILQSVPVLGFLSITVTGFIALFPGSLLGLEAASIFAIFTSQVWNMTFSFYQSLRTVPRELTEATTLNNQVLFTTYTPGGNAVGLCQPALGVNRFYAVSVIDGSPVANLNNQNNQTVNDRSMTLAQTGIAPNLAFLFPAPTQNTDASGAPVATSTQSNVLCMSGAEMLGSCKSFASRVKTYWKESDVP